MATNELPREHYLNSEFGIKSWLLTKDHKRIGILYLLSITFFFFIGGFFATLIRIHLLTPEGALVSADNYNKLFTMHGIMMVFFFLIPSVPAVLGNFVLPLMLGAKDVAFPKINLLSWYIFIIGGVVTLWALVSGGVDTGWTFYTPFSTTFSNTHVITAALGIFISTFSLKPIFGYKFVAFSSLAIAVFGFIVWSHHMFIAGISVYAAMVASFLSFAVAIPSAIKTFNWAATLYKGSISYRTPMLYAFGFLGLFAIGGLTGLFLATLGLDIHLHDTYFVIAHFHYIMVGGMVMAYLGGLHYWWPKISGRMYPEAWGKLSAMIIFLGFNLTFFPQFILGYLGMPRRYHSYPPEWQVLHVLSTAGASILAVGYVLPMVYLLWSLKYSEVAGPNPGGATGLEWQKTSPPPHHNFEGTPVVTEEAYDYSKEREAAFV